jgi:uncharacterized membrane protein
MNQAYTDILNPNERNVELFRSANREIKVLSGTDEQTNDLMVLGSLLILVQILDGLFTAIGINSFGIAIEGNPLIRSAIEVWGVVPTLFSIKLATITVTIFLMFMVREVEWLRKALQLTVGVYLLAAIIPWSAILLDAF